jgi:hypothetical protein
MNRQPDTVAIGVIALGVLLALNSLLGPLAFDVIEYRYGPSMINQAIGLDAVALAVATPLAVAAGILIRRGHRAGPVLAMAPALFAAYMMPQYLIGPDYLNLPGNNENFALGHIAMFVLAVAVAIGAWRAVDPELLRPNTRKSDHRRSWVLIGVAAFIALGRQLPAVIAVMGDPTANEAYQDNATAFWLVVFLDLGVVTPAALAAAIGLRRGATWARTAAYAVIGWFSLVPISVFAMNVVMRVNDDPLVTTADTVVFGVAALVLTAGAVVLYRPLFAPDPPVTSGQKSGRRRRSAPR